MRSKIRSTRNDNRDRPRAKRKRERKERKEREEKRKSLVDRLKSPDSTSSKVGSRAVAGASQV